MLGGPKERIGGSEKRFNGVRNKIEGRRGCVEGGGARGGPRGRKKDTGGQKRGPPEERVPTEKLMQEPPRVLPLLPLFGA